MMRTRFAIVVALCATSLFAQSTPPPTMPVPAPLTGYTGRFLDSASVRDYQAPIRTLRTDLVKIAPELDSIFVKAGGGVFGVYRLSSFPSKIGPLTSLIVYPPRLSSPEKYLPFDMSVDPQRNGSGWQWSWIDGQDFLRDFDWDDRGYIYLAYSAWGFGIVDSSGTLISQVADSGVSSDPPPNLVCAFLNGGRHYLLVGAPSYFTSVIYDVTDPSAPIRVRQLGFGFSSCAKNAAGDTIALLRYGPTTSLILQMYTSAQLLADGSPIEVPATGSRTFTHVTSDGLNFYATQSPSSGLVLISRLTADGGGAFAKDDLTQVTSSVNVSLRFNSGYLTYIGGGGYGTVATLFRLENSVLTPSDIGPYVQSNRVTAYVIPREIVPFCTDAGSFAIFALHGIGDVFGLTPGVAACPPHAPTEVTAIAGDGSATVSFTSPANDGGAPITSYIVKSMPDGITATGVSSPIMVPGLTNNTTYTFTVQAQNSAGFSSPSAPSNAATPAATLLPPAIVIATASSTSQVKIDWSSAAGAATYKVLRSTGGAFTEVGSTSDLTLIDNGDIAALTANTTYLYAIVSIDNSDTASEQSDFDHATTTIFTDDSLTAGSRPKAVYLSELHAAVNAMRIAAGLDAVPFADPLAGDTTIAAADLTGLRQALDDARTPLHMPSASYTDGSVQPAATLLKWQHVQELRDAVK